MEMAAEKRNKKTVDMTSGSIVKSIIAFALPLLLGNFFQQLYNMVDAFVIGQKGTPGEYSAVGSVAPITNILIGLFSGLSSGASVVIAQYFGAKDKEKVSLASHTAIALTLVASALFTAGVLCAPLMVRMMLRTTGGDVYAPATAYLTIYSSGLTFMLLYNMGSGILRAVGDSRRPFYFLAVAAVINTALDFIFVFALDMGVNGVALATVIAQGVAAFLTAVTLLKTGSDVKIRLKKLRLNGKIIGQIVRVGIPAAIQLALTAFSNVFVQSYINAFGSACMAGWGCYHRLDQFLLLPMQSISMGSTTFMGQNIGARNLKRAEKGVHTAIGLSLAVTAVLTVLLNIFCQPLIRIFNEDPAVVTYGSMFVRMISPFYLVVCFNQIYAGALRGAGDAKAPMVMMLFSFVLFRQIYLFVGTQFINTEWFVGLGYPAGWVVCSILQMAYFYKSRWRDRCRAAWSAEDAARELKKASA